MEEGWEAAQVGGVGRVHSREHEAPVLPKYCHKSCWELPEEMEVLSIEGCGFPYAVHCREKGRAGKAGSECPCGLWVLVAQLQVSCAFWRTDEAPCSGGSGQEKQGGSCVVATSMLGLLGSLRRMSGW